MPAQDAQAMIVAAEPGDDKEDRQHSGDGQDDGDLEHGFRCGNSNLSPPEHKGKDSVSFRVADYAGRPNSLKPGLSQPGGSDHYRLGMEKGRTLKSGLFMKLC